MVKNDICAMAFGKPASADLLGALLASILTLLLLLVIGKYLWNNTLAKLVTVVKPATSIWQIFGLMLLLSLLLK